MNGRDCLQCIFDGKKPERLPKIEWATWWDLTMKRWQTEGLDTSLANKTIKMNFGLDYDRQIWFPTINNCKDTPKFKEQGYISDEEEYEKIRPFLYDKKMIYDLLPELDRIHEQDEEQGAITWFTLDGFFWFPRVLFGIEDHLYSFYDYPELYHRICQDMVDYYLFLIEETMKHWHPQFMTFAEDMSYNLGPMLSEQTFNEFLKPYYDQIIPVLKRYNIRVFVDTDGDLTKMVPWLINAGFNGALPLERQAGVDINMLTQQYPDFMFLGGYDKMIMKFGEEAMTKEFERILPAMRRGHYIPSVDHQTPPDVSLENYKIYIELLEKYCKLAVK